MVRIERGHASGQSHHRANMSPTLRTIDAIKAQALREAADDIEERWGVTWKRQVTGATKWLRERADSLDPPVT